MYQQKVNELTTHPDTFHRYILKYQFLISVYSTRNSSPFESIIFLEMMQFAFPITEQLIIDRSIAHSTNYRIIFVPQSSLPFTTTLNRLCIMVRCIPVVVTVLFTVIVLKSESHTLSVPSCLLPIVEYQEFDSFTVRDDAV